MDKGEQGRAVAGLVGGGVKWGCIDTEQSVKWPFLSVVNMRAVKGKNPLELGN
jgi:hypothetical protein